MFDGFTLFLTLSTTIVGVRCRDNCLLLADNQADHQLTTKLTIQVKLQVSGLTRCLAVNL